MQICHVVIMAELSGRHHPLLQLVTSQQDRPNFQRICRPAADGTRIETWLDKPLAKTSIQQLEGSPTGTSPGAVALREAGTGVPHEAMPGGDRPGCAVGLEPAPRVQWVSHRGHPRRDPRIGRCRVPQWRSGGLEPGSQGVRDQATEGPAEQPVRTGRPDGPDLPQVVGGQVLE